MKNQKKENELSSRIPIIISWIAMILASSLGIIIWREFVGQEPNWWPLVNLSGILIIFFATLYSPLLRSLRAFMVILLIIFLLGFGGGWQWGLIYFVRNSEIWIGLENSLPWAISSILTHLLRLSPALIIMLFLLLIGRSRSDLFLIKGDIVALANPTKILGMKEPKPWPRLAVPFVIVFSIGTLTFLILTTHYTFQVFLATLPLIPVVIFIAAINGFNEEFTLRAAPLSETSKAIGQTQGLLITTIFFGIGHYYGVPNGLIGVLLSTFLGWFLGKSMLETKGFFWAWLIHFTIDIFIFFFYAMSIVA